MSNEAMDVETPTAAPGEGAAAPAAAPETSKRATTPTSEKRVRKVNPKFADSQGSLGFIGDPAHPPKKLPKGYSYETVPAKKKSEELPSKRKRKRKPSDDYVTAEATPKRRKLSAQAEEIKRKKAELEEQVKAIDSQLQGLTEPSPPAKKAPVKKSAPKKKAAPKVKSEKAATAAPTAASERSKRVRKKKSMSVPASTEMARVMRKCKKAVMDTLAHPMAWPFEKPVDAVALELWDYHDIIKRPMDLGTVVKNIDNGEYKTIDDVVADVNQVWTNCMTYNLAGSDICVMCQKVKVAFEKNIAKVRREEEKSLQKAASRAAAKKRGSQSAAMSAVEQVHQAHGGNSVSAFQEIVELRQSMQDLKQELTLLRQQQSVATPAATPKQDPNEIPMTHAEKQELTKKITSGGLGPEHLGMIVQLIQQSMPHLSAAGKEEIEIDLNLLDTRTLRKLERYVEFAKPKKKTKKKVKPRVGRKAPPPSAEVAPAPVAPAPSATAADPAAKDAMDVESGSAPAVVSESVVESASSGSDSGRASDTDSDSSSDSDFDLAASAAVAAAQAAAAAAPDQPASTANAPAEGSKTGGKAVEEVSFAVEAQVADKDRAALVSSAEPEEGSAPPIVSTATSEVKEVEVEDETAWDPSNLEESTDVAPQNGESEGLWSAFKEKEQLLREKQRERDERERLALEKQREVEAQMARKLEEERKRVEEEEQRVAAEKKAEQARLDKEIEERRKAARLAREQRASSTPKVDLTEQSKMMAQFEKNLGGEQ